MPDVLVALNAPSLTKFGPAVAPGGVIVYDSSVVADAPAPAPDVTLVGVPCLRIAAELGQAVTRNIVALGALQAATGLFPEETFLTALRQTLREKPGLVSLNEEAFHRGARTAVP